MKSYTDFEQSAELMKILPLESADMHFERAYFDGKQSNWFIKLGEPIKSNDVIPCWSLAALIGSIPGVLLGEDNKTWSCAIYDKETHTHIFGMVTDNPIDTCYEMIIKLHKLNLL